MKNPLVSIIIPVFNRENLISQTLESVLDQEYKDWQCIIIDDGSTDNSINLIESFVARDSRMQLILRPENRIKGANTCRNIGIENSKGKYIQFLDSDDVLLPNKIKLQIETLIKEDEKTIAICDWDRFSIKVEEANFDNIYPYSKDFDSVKDYLKALGTKWIPPLCYLVPEQLVRLAGIWDENLIINQDAEYFSRIIRHSKKIKFVSSAKVLYRYHTKGNVSKETASKSQAKVDSFKQIELNLKPVYGDNKNDYVEGVKRQYYSRIKNRFPEIIKRNREFFKNQIRERYIVIRILRKIKRNFERLFINN